MLAHGILLRRRWSPSFWTSASSWSRTKLTKFRNDTKKTSHGRQFQKFFRSTTTMPGTTNQNDDEDEDEDVSSSSSVPVVFSTIPRLGQGVRVGHYANTTRTYRRQEVNTFARLLHDFNPIHGTNMSSSSSTRTRAVSKNTTTNTKSSNNNSTDNSNNNNNNNTEEDLRTVMELQQESYQKAGLVREKEDTPNTTTEDTTAIIPSSSSSSLVHGMFVAGIFSSLFAALAPGCIYLNQTLEFVAPVFVNTNATTNSDDIVIGCLQIEKLRPMRRNRGGIVVHCHTRVYKQSQHGYHRPTTTLKSLDPPQPQSAQLVIHGRATVWLPLGYAGTTTTMTTTRPVRTTPPQ